MEILLALEVNRMTDKNTVPPYTNRGAQSTKQEGLRVCVDWVSVTFLGITNPYEIITLLGLKEDDFEAKETGKFGYPYHLRNGYIAIYYSDRLEHVFLEISGQGCREYEAKNIYDWSTLFSLFLMLKINITRLDLAVDDFKGYFKIRTLYAKLNRSHATSLFKDYRYMTKGKIAKREVNGHTVYLGSPTSRLLIRFYDKLAERLSKGKEIEEGITFWNRTEIQMRDERAIAAATLIANESFKIGDLIAGTLRHYINFRNPTKNKKGELLKNKSDWNICDFWTSFLGDVQPISLTQAAPDRTIESTLKWFNHSITPSLAVLLEAFDHDEELLKQWIADGNDRLSDRHKDMLKRFREQDINLWKTKKEHTNKDDMPKTDE